MTIGAPPEARHHRVLLTGSAWLLATVGANAVSGFAFWLIAYRVDDADDVGLAVALFTSALFCAYATNLGLPVAIARYAPGRDPASRTLFAWSVVLTAAASVAGMLGFRLLAPDRLLESLDAAGPLSGAAVFLLVVAGISLAVVVEVRLMTLRRWGWVLSRVLIVGAVRLPLLFIRPLADDGLWLFLLVAGTPALSGLVGAAMLLVRARPTRWWPLPASVVAARHFAAVNYLGLLAAQAPQFAVPVIVLVNVSESQNAAFYAAWSIATTLFLIPHVIGQVLLVAGDDDERLDGQVRVALTLSVAVMVAVAVAGALGADLVTFVYGDTAEDAVPLIAPFLAAGVAWAITATCLARARILEDSRAVVAITVTYAAITLAVTAVLVPEQGIEGAATGWLAGNLGAAVLAAVLTRRRPATRRETPAG